MSNAVCSLVAIPPLPGLNVLGYGASAIIGTIAAVFTTVSLVPQLVRIWTLKSAKDVSLGMFLMYSLGLLLWFIYGVMIHSLPVEAANGIGFVFSLAILILKIHFDRQETMHCE